MKGYQRIYRCLISAALLTLSMQIAYATHNRAGEITMRQVSDLTYEITITTFTYTLSAADRPSLEVQWGDNSTSVASRVGIALLGNFYQRNIYISQHTFPGPGTYQIVVQDPNRNQNVQNIPNSVNVVFSIRTIITINPGVGANSTPVLLNPPIDKAALGQIFIHNPAAFDPDGDSISYSLTVCTKENGLPIANYSFPRASDSLYVDRITGDLVWNTPMDTGIFNIAMNIEEWRKGIKIGNIVRDMQVEVYRTSNNAPVNDSLPSLCVLAGETVNYLVISRDADNDRMSHLLTGGPFAAKTSPATYTKVDSLPGYRSSRFIWNTSCNHARQQAYSVVVKTTDNNPELNLVDIDNMFIKVLAPSPGNLQAIPSSNSVNLFWSKYECPNILGYNIYRKVGSSGYSYDSCTPGLPASSGFILAGFTTSINDTSFQDSNNGSGLLQGTEYCFRIAAVLPDGSESFPSGEVCTTLVPGSPSLLNASVTNRDAAGSVFLSWARPQDLDTIPANGPYEYKIYRAPNLWGTNALPVHSFKTADLNDTTWTDSPLNTLLYPYSYRIELYNDAPGNVFLIGTPEIASTLYPEIANGDNKITLEFRKNVPWLNESYVVYRYNQVSGMYDSIATTTEDRYTDGGLLNGNTYCYYVKSKGSRFIDGVEFFTENLSHEACGTPGDTIPPCPPQLTVSSNCDLLYNELDWSYRLQDAECSEDVVKYYIYYTSSLSQEMTIIDSLSGRGNTFYRHYPAEALAACYYVTAIDSFGNESIPSIQFCIDNCANYALPNVFTPNNDQKNDILKPTKNQDVESIDLKIFNRWGQVVFETKDPEINWDGKFKGTNTLVSPGVYYYICDVYEYRLTGIEPRNLVGFLHVYHEKGANNTFNDETEL